jgi:hypothetical protein
MIVNIYFFIKGLQIEEKQKNPTQRGIDGVAEGRRGY